MDGKKIEMIDLDGERCVEMVALLLLEEGANVDANSERGMISRTLRCHKKALCANADAIRQGGKYQ